MEYNECMALFRSNVIDEIQEMNLACSNGDEEAVKKYIKSNKILYSDCMFLACKNRHLNLVKLLYKVVYPDDLTILTIIKNDDIEMMYYFCKQENFTTNNPSILLMATQYGSITMFKKIIEFGAHNEIVESIKHSIKNNLEDKLLILLQTFDNIDLNSFENVFGHTSPKILEILILYGLDINNNIYLYETIINNNYELFVYLIEKGLDIHHDDDYCIRLILVSKNVPMLKYLLETQTSLDWVIKPLTSAFIEFDSIKRYGTSRDVAEFLLERGFRADINLIEYLFNFSYINNFIILMNYRHDFTAKDLKRLFTYLSYKTATTNILSWDVETKHRMVFILLMHIMINIGSKPMFELIGELKDEIYYGRLYYDAMRVFRVYLKIKKFIHIMERKRLERLYEPNKGRLYFEQLDKVEKMIAGFGL